MKDREPQEGLMELELRFMEQWHQGENPSLEEYASRYPQFADELTDFVLVFAVSQRSETGDADEVTIETRTAVERGLKASRSQAQSLVERLRELDIKPEKLSEKLDLPPTMVLWLNQRTLVELPRVLVTALAHELCQTTIQILNLIRPPATRVRSALHYRSTGQPQARSATIRTFSEALVQCHKSNLASDKQLQRWMHKGEQSNG